MRDLLGTCLAKMEEQLLDVKKSKYWSKSAQNDADLLVASVIDRQNALKKAIGKKSLDVDDLKNIIMKGAGVYKEVQASLKEWKGIANKTGSTASSRQQRK